MLFRDIDVPSSAMLVNACFISVGLLCLLSMQDLQTCVYKEHIKCIKNKQKLKGLTNHNTDENPLAMLYIIYVYIAILQFFASRPDKEFSPQLAVGGTPRSLSKMQGQGCLLLPAKSTRRQPVINYSGSAYVEIGKALHLLVWPTVRQ